MGASYDSDSITNWKRVLVSMQHTCITQLPKDIIFEMILWNNAWPVPEKHVCLTYYIKGEVRVCSVPTNA